MLAAAVACSLFVPSAEDVGTALTTGYASQGPPSGAIRTPMMRCGKAGGDLS